MAGMISSWLEFWDKPNSIYVNARHKDVHYRLVAQQIAALVPSPQARVLDYGSGEALYADRIAAVTCELLLCEGAPSVRAGLAARFAATPNIRVLTPEAAARLPEQSLDLLVFHSVAQYLTPEQTSTLLVLFRKLLKPEGKLLVGDVIPPHLAVFADVAALLRFARQHGFLGSALLGLFRTVFSDYSRLRSRFGIGITCYEEADMIAKLNAAGFAAERAPTLVGYNQVRMVFVARPR